ncbi:MAG: hypothetical protein AAFQ84_01815, partial [Pseudomonadota bacterium]
MAKRPSLVGSMARPKSNTAGSTVERVDRLAEVMSEAKSQTDAPAKKPQRSREGMVSFPSPVSGFCAETFKAKRAFSLIHTDVETMPSRDR